GWGSTGRDQVEWHRSMPMTFPIVVRPENGLFAAALVGEPQLRKLAPTRSEAIAALKAALEDRIRTGEFLSLDVDPAEHSGLASLAGKYRDDPTLREIAEEAYRLRDAELDE